MFDGIIFTVKAIILTEASTHALRSWGIFDTQRQWFTSRSAFLSRLLSCYECTAVWTASGVLLYLHFLDFWPLTWLLIISRLATIAHIAVDLVDAWRAATINKL